MLKVEAGLEGFVLECIHPITLTGVTMCFASVIAPRITVAIREARQCSSYTRFVVVVFVERRGWAAKSDQQMDHLPQSQTGVLHSWA